MTSTTLPSAVKSLPNRADVPVHDCWDLSSLFASDADWEAAFSSLESKVATYETYRGRLGESAATLLEALQFDSDFSRDAERIAIYSFLKTTEDQANSDYQGMKARFQNLAV